MVRVVALVFIWFLSTNTLFAQKPEFEKVQGNIKWVFDYDEAKRISESSGKPMFVVFRCER